MSLKLIREAQLRTTISADEAKMLEVVKTATGAASIVDLIKESFTPSAEDYEAWMRVVVGEAQDRGVNIGKRSAFIELTMDMLEQDPANPPLNMQEMIANKLWQDYQGAKHEVRIQNAAKAQEDEEKVAAARKQIAARYSQGPSTSTTTSNPSAYDEEESGDTWGYVSNGVTVRLGDRKYAERHCNEIGKKCVKLSPLTRADREDQRRSSGQEGGMLGYEDEEVDDWVRNGGKIQQIAARPPRAGEKWQGSAHIGKASERPGRSTTGKAANTLGRPVIGLSKVSSEDEEMGISDDLAANKIFAKIQGTPNLSFVNVERMVSRYLPMVGKSPTDAKYIASLVYSKLQDNGMTVEDEESGFEQAVKMSQGIEDEQDSGMSFLDDVIKSRQSRGIDKGSFSAHLRGDDNEDPDAEFELVNTLDKDSNGDLSDDEVFTSTDDDDNECECPCEDDMDMDDEDMEGESDVDDEDTSEFADTDFDDNTMDDVDADVKRKVPAEKSYDEEEAVKSFFRQAVTSPRNMLTQAVKDIEDEGKAAWKKANVPSNPHPQKSQAYRAWQKGMMVAAKEALGIVDKPTPVKKPKRKK